jgi:hypothetical protein
MIHKIENMYRSILVILAFFLLNSSAVGQELGFGFRAGITSSKFLGDSEIGSNGEELEEYTFTSGFHIGVSINFKMTDLFGFRSELVFSQRGTNYKYVGDSYYLLGRGTSSVLPITGIRTQKYDVSTANFEIPLTAYYRLGSFEISGGISVALQLAATGGGKLEFDGMAPLTGSNIDPFEVRLLYNYYKDAALGGTSLSEPVVVDGTTYLIPGTVGAYWDFDEKDKNMFNTLDLGLTGGLSYFLNAGLYLGARVTYGLSDVDRNEYDISHHQLDSNGDYIFRDDKNTNLSMHFSIGFSF